MWWSRTFLTLGNRIFILELVRGSFKDENFILWCKKCPSPAHVLKNLYIPSKEVPSCFFPIFTTADFLSSLYLYIVSLFRYIFFRFFCFIQMLSTRITSTSWNIKQFMNLEEPSMVMLRSSSRTGITGLAHGV